MTTKTLAEHFLKKELKDLADLRGDVPIAEQSVYDDKEAKKVKVKEKKIK